MIRVAVLLQEVAAGLEGEEFTGAVRKVYAAVVDAGPNAAAPDDYEAIVAADGDLTLMPNATLTTVGITAVREAFAG